MQDEQKVSRQAKTDRAALAKALKTYTSTARSESCTSILCLNPRLWGGGVIKYAGQMESGRQVGEGLT